MTQNEMIAKLFEFLDYTEESDSGRVFHPITFSCCRVMMHQPFVDLLTEMKASIT